MEPLPILLAGLILLSCLLFLSQIIIHMCVHNSLFGRNKTLNSLLGNILASIQLTNFEGWKAAHLLHHRYANTEKDPHHINCSLPKYLLTHYFRIVALLWNPRKYFAAILPPIVIAVVVVIIGFIFRHGYHTISAVFAWWLFPVCISQTLVAHFNYITHVGLPAGRGKDTRNLSNGIWKLINLATFNFYLHAEHHLNPGKAIPNVEKCA